MLFDIALLILLFMVWGSIGGLYKEQKRTNELLSGLGIMLESEIKRRLS